MCIAYEHLEAIISPLLFSFGNFIQLFLAALRKKTYSCCWTDAAQIKADLHEARIRAGLLLFW